MVMYQIVVILCFLLCIVICTPDVNIENKSLQDHILEHKRFKRLINGKDEPIVKAPYMASLLLYSNLHCGAAIIKDNILITAAHCM